MPQQLFQGSDTATWLSSIPSVLVPSKYTSRKVLLWLLSNSGIQWQGGEATGTGYSRQAESWNTKCLAGQSIVHYLLYLLTTTFCLSTGKCPLSSTETSQEPWLLLLSVGSHFSLTNDIARHFVCLTHVYVSEFLLSHWVTSPWSRIKTPFSSLGLFLLDSNNNPP